MAIKTLVYGESSDTINIGSINWDASDSYYVYGNGGDDWLNFYIDGTVYMDMGSGNDTVSANGSGTGSIYGGDRDDLLTHSANYGDDGVFKLYGGNGNDYIRGFAGEADLIYGGWGNDTMEVGKGNVAYGGQGNDTYYLETGSVFLEQAGQGYDTVVSRNLTSFSFSGTNIEAFRSTYVGEGGTLTNITITGDAANNAATTGNGTDKLTMGGGNDTADGGGGMDSIYGGTGNDVLAGGNGNDKIWGDDGNDMLRGDGSTFDPYYGGDSLYGGAGDDTLESGHASGGQSDFLYGGAGNDTYQYLSIDGMGSIHEDVNGGIDTLETKLSNMGTPDNVENMTLLVTHTRNPVTGIYTADRSDGYGNALANVMTGHIGANFIFGGDGADTIRGLDGHDTVSGGNQNDLLYGGAGNDSLNGDSSNDWVYGGDGNDAVLGASGSDTLIGNAGDDTMIGSSGNDLEYGSDGTDRLDGGDGYDTLVGEAGNDALMGGGNSDYLYGGDANDMLSGGGSGDIMSGGLGADSFVFSNLTESAIGTGIDKVTDFSAAQGDKINLAPIDADVTSFNNTFVWKGMSMPEVAKAGNLWGQYFAATVYNPETVRVYGDVNSDNVADFSIDVQNLTTLDALAFIL